MGVYGFVLAGTVRNSKVAAVNPAGKRTNLYWFNWPSHVGGADTKFVHLLPLLAEEFEIITVPNARHYLDQKEWVEYLNRLGVAVALREELPERIDGWAVSLCNKAFFKEGIAADMKRRGARIAWSNEMMWHFEGELSAVENGLVDRVMYVSAAQRAALEPAYRNAAGAPGTGDEAEALCGEIPRGRAAALPWVLTGNWIDPAAFPFRRRGAAPASLFSIGRLSRPDPDKFPDNFPRFYEGLGLDEPLRFRVMGWSDRLAERWSEHAFDSRWELLPPAAEEATRFLNSLDLFVYGLSPRFRESWGRAVVEAMLSGAVPLVPRGGGHHLENLVAHGVSGFLCSSQEEFGHYARLLQKDSLLLGDLSAAARKDACLRHCHAETHRAQWRRVFQ